MGSRFALALVWLAGCGASVVSGSAREVVWIDPPASVGGMSVNVAAASGGVLLTWVEPAAGGHRVRFSRFDEAGWAAPVTIASGVGVVASWADVPSVVESPRGWLIASWPESSRPGSESYDVMLARSDDRGASWRRLGPAHDDGTATEHGFASLVIEGDQVRAYWLDGRETASGGATSLRTALVGDRVSDERVVDARVCDCCSTSAVGGLIAYRDRGDDEVRDISIASRPGWQVREVHRDGWRIAGCPVNGPAMAAAGRDVAIAWYTDAGKRPSVRAAFSRDGGATFAPAVEVDGPTATQAPLGRVSVVLDRGEALVGWVRAGGPEAPKSDAEIAVRRVAQDGRLGPVRSIARTSAERSSGVPRMVALDDRLVLAWTERGPRVRAMMLSTTAIAPVGESGARAVAAAAPTGPATGERAPDYRVRSLRGAAASLAGLRGRVVLLNFWATWCAPCRRELPDLAVLHRQRVAAGLQVVAVSIDDPADRDRAAAVARDLPFAVWHDPDNLAAERFGVRSLPTTLLIGRDGTIRWRRDGVIDAADPAFRAALDAALSEGQRSGP